MHLIQPAIPTYWYARMQRYLNYVRINGHRYISRSTVRHSWCQIHVKAEEHLDAQ